MCPEIWIIWTASLVFDSPRRQLPFKSEQPQQNTAYSFVVLFDFTSVPTVNLARGKTAWQVDVSSGGLPSRAVDGNKNGQWGGNSCTATSSDSNKNLNNWWTVDLQRRTEVMKVTLYNRADCCGTRLANFDIVVTDTKPQSGKKLVYNKDQVCIHKTGAIPQGKSESFNCQGSKKGQYVAIVQTRTQILTLCEVEIFGGNC